MAIYATDSLRLGRSSLLSLCKSVARHIEDDLLKLLLCRSRLREFHTLNAWTVMLSFAGVFGWLTLISTSSLTYRSR